ncbi:MAG: elongation factor G, partial [Armatimonadetes bacterium]|nr:elongation factor G [Armatimonadota bacterium]
MKNREERIGQVYRVRGKQQEAVSEIDAGDIGAVAKLSDTSTGDTLCDATHPIVLDPIEFPRPVYEQAIIARTKVDEDKMGPALQRLLAEDPTFNYRRDGETGQTMIAGMGETHLNIVVERLRRFGANVDIAPVRVPYRETITRKAEGQGKHKKQTGGRGQYGDCWIRMEPKERSSGFEIIDAIVGGAIPRQYIPAVEKGVVEAMSTGIQAGYPVVDVKVTCYDGSYHDVDSSEQAFKMAGILAFNSVAAKAGPAILEPIVSVSVYVPDDMMGDVISDLNGKRGRILGMEP